MKRTNLILAFMTGSIFLVNLVQAQTTINLVNTTTGTTPTPTIFGTSLAGNSSSWTEGVHGLGKNGTSNYGVLGEARLGNNFNIGVYGLSDSAGVTGIGVFGQALDAASSNYGVYGTAAGGGNTNYAGYFDGDVFTTGSYLPSDEKLKKNIQTETSVLDKLRRLRPVSYNFKSAELKFIHLPNNLQHGFVAQELKEVFPEAVKTIKHPVVTGNKITGTEDIEAVNYQALIPILVKAIQEQQNTIDDLKKQVNALAARTTMKSGAKSAYLAQSFPNPSNTTTTIKYAVPDNAGEAVIEVHDLNGNKVLQFNNIKGESQVTVDDTKLASGTYIYSLVVNGKETISKKFVIAKG